MGGILIQERRNYCSKFKKGKLKTKKLLKINSLDEQESSVQSEVDKSKTERSKAAQAWNWGNIYLPKPEKGSHGFI